LPRSSWRPTSLPAKPQLQAMRLWMPRLRVMRLLRLRLPVKIALSWL
jgi:hypothetical protein